MKKILIAGCGGMVGSSLYTILTKNQHEVIATDIDTNEPWIKWMDVRDFKGSKSMIEFYEPDVIVNLSAITNLENCDKDIVNANNTNHLGARNLSQIANELRIPIVVITTAGVFDGTKNNYTEEDTPNPINSYGKTKYAGELATRYVADKSLIVRCGWMFGGGKKDKKFVGMIASQIRSGKKDFKIVNDKKGSLTYTRDLAVTLERLIDNNVVGDYNVVCGGMATRLDVAKVLIDFYNVKDYTLEEVSSAHFNNQFSTNRANSEILDTSKLGRTGYSGMQHWRKAMSDYLGRQSNEIGDYFKEVKK